MKRVFTGCVVRFHIGHAGVDLLALVLCSRKKSARCIQHTGETRIAWVLEDTGRARARARSSGNGKLLAVPDAILGRRGGTSKNALGIRPVIDPGKEFNVFTVLVTIGHVATVLIIKPLPGVLKL